MMYRHAVQRELFRGRTNCLPESGWVQEDVVVMCVTVEAAVREKDVGREKEREYHPLYLRRDEGGARWNRWTTPDVTIGVREWERGSRWARQFPLTGPVWPGWLTERISILICWESDTGKRNIIDIRIIHKFAHHALDPSRLYYCMGMYRYDDILPLPSSPFPIRSDLSCGWGGAGLACADARLVRMGIAWLQRAGCWATGEQGATTCHTPHTTQHRVTTSQLGQAPILETYRRAGAVP
ncbi:hypothetical protein HOY80DRAFT_1022420 [Tuber brumale]|nr:hypothetical protein HOY80DRAFT_1022420 [Tuber brumale]